MLIDDKLYGKFEIKEDIIKELIKSQSFQRLKRIGMAGYELFLSKNHPFSKFSANRYEHSIGVYILLTRLNASLEERVAGLLHDISILALSHIGDCVYGRFETQDFHEELKEKFIRNSEISTILKKYKLGVEKILDEKKFTLLDKPLPDLCADRIDYSLRHLIELREISRREALDIIKSLSIWNNEIIFSNFEIGRKFSFLYLFLNKEFYCNPLQATIFKMISNMVKIGMKKGVLNEADLFKTDDIILSKLKNSDDREILNMLSLVSDLKVIEDSENYDFFVKSKVRWVDPKVLVENRVLRLSEIDSEYRKVVKKWIERVKKGFKVRIL